MNAVCRQAGAIQRQENRRRDTRGTRSPNRWRLIGLAHSSGLVRHQHRRGKGQCNGMVENGPRGKQPASCLRCVNEQRKPESTGGSSKSRGEDEKKNKAHNCYERRSRGKRCPGGREDGEEVLNSRHSISDEVQRDKE